MFRIALIALALAPHVAAVGVPTDAAVYTFTDGVPDDNLDVVGRVLKFMDPTRAADPKEILRQLGVPPKPAPAAEAGRVLQAMETYEPTTVTYAPTTITYQPTTETYAPTGADALVTYKVDVAAATRDDVVAAIPGYKIVFAQLANTDPANVAIKVSETPISGTRRLEAAELAAGGRSLQDTVSLWVLEVLYIIPAPQAEAIVEALETKDVPAVNAAIDAAFDAGAFGDPATSSKPPEVEKTEDVVVTPAPEEEIPSDTLEPTLMPSPLPSPVPTKAPVM